MGMRLEQQRYPKFKNKNIKSYIILYNAAISLTPDKIYNPLSVEENF